MPTLKNLNALSNLIITIATIILFIKISKLKLRDINQLSQALTANKQEEV